MNNLVEVSKTDLEKLTSAVLDEWRRSSNTGPWQSEEMRCRFCDRLAETTSVKDHELSCPVLVARDLTLRATE